MKKNKRSIWCKLGFHSWIFTPKSTPEIIRTNNYIGDVEIIKKAIRRTYYCVNCDETQYSIKES